MSTPRSLPTVLATAALIGLGLLLPGSATGQGGGLTTAPASSAAPTSTPPPPSSPPLPEVVPGHVKLVIQHAFGNPQFVVAGARMVLRGIVIPYVAGQKVKVSFYRDGRKLDVKTVAVLAVGNGAGQFHLSYSSAGQGLVQATAVHYATPQQGQFAARSASVRFMPVNLHGGSQGPAVRLLQSELNVLHYAVPLNGVFDEATGRAVTAYRKLAGLARVPYTDAHVFAALQRGVGGFHVHYPGDGRHVEADLTRQVLAEIEPAGHVERIYMMSSGKPSTPTVIGRFQVYSKTPGTNAKGMVDSNYFIRGYAIHGYAEVPPYAASHGCLRVPIPNAASIYAWVRLGTQVDVYNESGGGSSHVRGNAGP
ncbi:MAG TPA: L,D-transpeptidase family protein [Solirubrobacteraceae bacterium]